MIQTFSFVRNIWDTHTIIIIFSIRYWLYEADTYLSPQRSHIYFDLPSQPTVALTFDMIQARFLATDSEFLEN